MTTVARKILHYLSIDNRPQTPLEIAQNLKLNPNTVRARLSELRKKGKVLKEFEHHYVIAAAHGVEVVCPRVQNLQVRVGVPVRVEHRGPPGSGFKESVIEMGDLSVVLQFGYQKQQVNYQVSTPRGLDLDGFRAVHVAVGKQLQIMGYKSPGPGDWWVIKYELLFDHGRVRMESVKALTWQALDGTLEKYYNRDSGLRREIRSTNVIAVQDLEHLLTGGMAHYQYQQGLNVLRVEVGHLTEGLRGIHDQYRDMLEMFKASHKASIRLIDQVDALFTVSSRDRWDKARVLREDGSFVLMGMDVGLRTQLEEEA